MSDPLPYDLCLKLKEAGWKQPSKVTESHGGEYVWPEVWHSSRPKPNAYSPSLEELIEACEPPPIDKFYFYLSGSKASGLWEAFHAGYEATPEKAYEGATPKEALAHLWLKLQETKTDK